jgi:hypothetical protein
MLQAGGFILFLERKTLVITNHFFLHETFEKSNLSNRIGGVSKRKFY